MNFEKKRVILQEDKGGGVVDKVIQDIVAIDIQCAKAVEEAKKKKQDVQSNMSAKKKEIYDSFVNEYQIKIDARKKELEDSIKDTKEKNEQAYQKSLSQLSSLYEKNKDEWVETLVDRCKQI